MADLGFYTAYDRRRQRHLRAPVSACFAPLLTAAPDARMVARMLRTLTSTRFWAPAGRGGGIASYDRRAPGFSAHQYWRGPAWVNINWGAIQGLRRHRRDAEAEALRRQTLDLVDRNGFWEYYDPTTGEGLGSEQFSWTAALVLDLLTTQLVL